MNNNLKASCFIAMTLTTSGCELIGPHMHEKRPLNLANEVEEVSQSDAIYQELSNKGSGEGVDNPPQIELYPGSGQFVGRGGDSQAARKIPSKGEYSLNFDDADLGEVAKVILSDILGENYIFSPKVGGKVTLQTTQPLTRAELLPTLEMLLQVNNAALLYQNGIYQIKPASEVIVSSDFTYGNGKNVPAGYQIKVVPVKNVGVNDLAEIIKPLLAEKSVVHVDPTRNILLLAGSRKELARAMEMVKTFDVDVMKGRSFGLFPLKNVEATTLIEELNQVFSDKDKDNGGFFRFLAIERLNAILAITHQPDYLQEIQRWVLRLDKANTSASGGVIVYRAQNVDAVELAATLNEIFGKGGKSSKEASVAAGRKAVEITNESEADKNKTVSTVSSQIGASLDTVGEVNIIADETNNALVIVATAQDYAVIQRVIKQLDVLPLQVLIDATIVDVTLTDQLKYGIQWFFNKEAGGTNTVTGGGTFFDDLGALGAAAVTGGFGYSFISEAQNIRVVLDAEANNGNINVISSPSLMVLNNQEANIQVGDEISLRTSQNTPLTSGVGPDNTLVQTSQLQQRKTGVKLKVKPRVNASGLVIMNIEQSVEDFDQSQETNGNPNILTREIASSVAIHSGETLVLGGLIKEKNSQSKAGVPILHEIPLLGPLFGSTTNNKDRTELVVLITPRVVQSQLDGRMVTNEFKRKLTGIYEEPNKEPVDEEL